MIGSWALGSHRVHDAGRSNEIPLAASVTIAAGEGDASRIVGDGDGARPAVGDTVGAGEQAAANAATSESSVKRLIRASIRRQTPEPARWLRQSISRALNNGPGVGWCVR